MTSVATSLASRQVLEVCSKLVARAVTACRPDTSWQAAEQVVVTVSNKAPASAPALLEVTGAALRFNSVRFAAASTSPACCLRAASSTWYWTLTAVADTGRACPDDIKVVLSKKLHCPASCTLHSCSFLPCKHAYQLQQREWTNIANSIVSASRMQLAGQLTQGLCFNGHPVSNLWRCQLH